MEATTGEAGARAGRAQPARPDNRSERPRIRRPRLRGPRNVAETERMLSVVGGGALALWGMRRRGAGGTLAALAGALLVERGVSGHCMVYDSLGLDTSGGENGLVQQHGPSAVLDASRSVRVEHAVTIARPREELYRFWRDFENLPRVMRHLESVQVLDDRRSRWVAKAPAGRTVEWVAEIHNEVPNEIIAWKSTDEATVPNAGSVHFSDAPGGRGTEVRVILEYAPPAGRLGGAMARLFREEPDHQVRDDLRRFKHRMESGASNGEG